MSSHVLVRYSESATIVECVDPKLSDEMTIQAWSEEVVETIDKSFSQDRVILSFSHVKFMSSSALRALITLRAKAEQKKIALFLCDINAANMEVFKITKLDSLFRITPTELEAQRAML